MRKSRLVRTLKRKLYSDLKSPMAAYESAIGELTNGGKVRILDVGCGYSAPSLRRLPKHVEKFGLDLVDEFVRKEAPDVNFVHADCSTLPFSNESFDIVISRSVLEHIEKPLDTFREIYRVLRPGGKFLFLTPNRWDYVSLIASVVPNRFHGRVVRWTTGRDESNTFPTRYRANTRRTLRTLAGSTGFETPVLDTLREHPHYLQFSALLYCFGAAYDFVIARPLPGVRPWIMGTFLRPGI